MPATYATLAELAGHVDPVRAQAGPFGATIAPGFLTLSLLPRQAWGAEGQSHDTVESVEQWLAAACAASMASATPAASAPDLLAVDYRQPQGRTGLQALAAFNLPVQP